MRTQMFCFRALCALSLLLAATAARAAIHNYYVTVDARPTLTSGAYLGLPNPNSGRLLLLYAHPNEEEPSSNHFHGIGAYSYTGTPPTHSIVPTNGNNRLPETFAGQAPLTLKPGSGPFAGKLVSGENGEHYSDLTLYSIRALAADAGGNPASPEGYMYGSNPGYTNTPMTGLNLGLEVVAMSPGLKLGAVGLTAPGAILPVGGEASLPFEPVFWTDAGTAPGTYSAALRFVDQSATFAPSGTFHFDFAVVPEPAAAGLMAGAALVVGVARGRRRR